MGLREQKKQETRRRVIAVAESLFRKKGYEATTVDEIADKAQISRMTFFNYFAGKDKILEAMAVKLFTKHGEFFEQMSGGEETINAVLPPQAEDRLDFFIQNRSLMGMLKKHTQLLNCFQASPSEAADTLSYYLVRHYQLRLDRVKNAQLAGSVRDDIPAHEICHLYEALRNDVVDRWLMEDDESGDILKSRFRMAMKIFLSGLEPEQKNKLPEELQTDYGN